MDNTILLKSGRESIDEVKRQGYVIYSGKEHDVLDRGKIYELLEIRGENLIIKVDGVTGCIYNAKNFTLPLHTEENTKEDYLQAKMEYEKCFLEFLELETLLNLKKKELKKLSDKTSKVLENIKVGIVKKYNEK